MANNTVERAITPYNPSQSEIYQKDRYNLYAPLVRRGQPGIAQFDPADFKISNGIVSTKDKIGGIQYAGEIISETSTDLTWSIKPLSVKSVEDVMVGDTILCINDATRNGQIYSITDVENGIKTAVTSIGNILGPRGYANLYYNSVYYSQSAVIIGLNVIQELYKFNREPFVGDFCQIVCVDMTQTPWVTYSTMCEVTYIDPTSMANRYATLIVRDAVQITGPQGIKGDKGNQGESVEIVGGIYYVGDAPVETGDLPLPAFNDTDAGEAYIVRDVEHKYDFYMHNVGAEDWVIIDDWGGIPGPKGDTGNTALTYDEVYFSSSPVNTSLNIIQEVEKFNRTAVIGDVCNIVAIDMTLPYWHVFMTTCIVTNVDTQFVTLRVNQLGDITGETGIVALSYSKIITVTNTTTTVNLISTDFNRTPEVDDKFLAVGNDGDSYYFLTLSVDSLSGTNVSCTIVERQSVDALPGKDALTYNEIYYSANPVVVNLQIIQEVAKFNRSAFVGDVCNIVCVQNSTQETFMTVCTVINVDSSYVTLSAKSVSKITGTNGANGVGIVSITIEAV